MAIRCKDGKYIVDYYPNGRKGRRVVFTLPLGTTEEQARKIEQEVRTQNNQQPQYLNPSGNISQLIKDYLKYCDLHQSPETVRDKRSHFNIHITPFFGRLHVSDLVNAHITAYKQQMKEKKHKGRPIGNKTISKGLNYFSAFLKWCDEELNISPNTPLYIRRLPSIRPMPIVLSLNEAMAFIDAADKLCRNAFHCPGNTHCVFKVAYNVMFKTFFYLGLRNRAVRRMRWEDMDWTKRAIKTIEKRSRVKWHPLPDDLAEELRGLYIHSNSPWIYPSPRDPQKPISNLFKAVRRAKKRAGITKRVHPHLLRHSIATHLVDSDVDIRQIQAFLDHSQISTTEWYAQVSIEKKRQALEKAGIKTSKP